VNPIKEENVPEASKTENLYLFPYPTKVIFKTKKRFLEVNQGNHAVKNAGEDLNVRTAQDIAIFHYPVRGKDHFYRKVINGGTSYAKRKIDDGSSYQWKGWFASYQKGTLDKDYEMLTVNEKQASRLMKNGVIEEHDALSLPSMRKNQIIANLHWLIKQKNQEILELKMEGFFRTHGILKFLAENKWVAKLKFLFFTPRKFAQKYFSKIS